MANHHPAESELKKKDTTAKQPERVEREQQKKQETPTVETAGKIVNFPAAPDSPSDPLAETASKQDEEPLSREHAACILEGLRMSYEAEFVYDGKKSKIWKERVDALTMAISALRK